MPSTLGAILIMQKDNTRRRRPTSMPFFFYLFMPDLIITEEKKLLSEQNNFKYRFKSAISMSSLTSAKVSLHLYLPLSYLYSWSLGKSIHCIWNNSGYVKANSCLIFCLIFFFQNSKTKSWTPFSKLWVDMHAN